METHLSYFSKEGLKQISVHCNKQQRKVYYYIGNIFEELIRKESWPWRVSWIFEYFILLRILNSFGSWALGIRADITSLVGEETEPAGRPSVAWQNGGMEFNPPSAACPVAGQLSSWNLVSCGFQGWIWPQGFPSMVLGRGGGGGQCWKWQNAKELERGQKGRSHCRRALGTESWVLALTSPKGQFLQSLSASFSPSVTWGIILPRSQSSLTPSLTRQHLLRTPCESEAGSDPRNRKVNRVDTITSSWNLLPSGRWLTASSR